MNAGENPATRKYSLGIIAAFLTLAIIACSLGTPSPTALFGLPSPTPGGPTPEPATEIPSATGTILVPPTEAPTATPTTHIFAVVLVPEGGSLEAHVSADVGSGVVGSLAWDAINLLDTGNTAVVGADVWVELNLPGGGTGWVNRKFLTEYVTSADFCVDGRVVSLFESLYEAARTNNGGILTPIVSPIHGLTVTYIHNGKSKLYDPGQAGMAFGSVEVVDWGLGPGSGLPVKGTFADLVRPDLLAVFGSAETHCNSIQLGGASYTVSWPSLWKNINFYSVYKPGSPGTELDWMTWLTGVEFVDGTPYLFSLSRYNWEP